MGWLPFPPPSPGQVSKLREKTIDCELVPKQLIMMPIPIRIPTFMFGLDVNLENVCIAGDVLTLVTRNLIILLMNNLK